MTTTNAAEARPAPATPDLTLCELGPSPIAGVESLSPFCLKVHRALALAGLRYTSRHAGNPAARRLNPTGQVPILLVGARAVSDSTAIVHEIDRLRPGVLTRGLDARSPRAGFWLGASPTVADVALFAQRHGLRNELTARQRAMVASRPALTAWLDRVDAATVQR